MGNQSPPVQGLVQGGKLILDDKGKVSKIYDRGESARLKRAPAKHDETSKKGKEKRLDKASPESDLIEKIADELDEAKVPYVLEPDRMFIPHSKLTKILTFSRIRSVVHILKCFSGEKDKEAISRRIFSGNPEKGKAPCVKLLAVLIGINSAELMAKHMLSDNMSDICLPIQKLTVNGKQQLRCLQHGFHSEFNNYRRQDKRERFSQWSYLLSAPYITRQNNLHSHYVLDTGDVFPMDFEYKVEQEASTETTAKGSGSDGNTYGGFSEVYKVRIHEGHYDFGEHGIRHPRGYFALKKLTSHNRTSFNLELSSLIFTGRNYKKKNMIQVLATFEVVNPATTTSTFYLLFDWAEGSLNKFWESNQTLVGDKSHCLWMANQFYEISEALQCVHNDHAQTMRYLEDRDSNKDLYGRHGDIKPGNFLWFHTNSAPGLIALSDFGLGRLHTQVSRSKQDPKNIERTATYRCPEFDLPSGQVSPRSDIFSLGCVMLEYVTWFMMGLHAVEQVFPSARSERDIYGFDSDVFFSVRDNNAVLKPSVVSWIRGLQSHPNCSWYISDLLDTIETGMLDPNGATRLPANRLTKRMRALLATCETTPNYYLGVRSRT
ncbi:protein kinase [Colletotrichum higginsianum]|uniref:Protein kinase n=1 Tax=Colletotrichum higginsianum (strain IMI 349063) TaxID=759273 RepID=H1VDZ4_COLHI|nr:Protein kinase [Colletotrichum higginsianum IMI 349063]OBR09626.1 Protein kinase [Colletotrichum higginsianum IMI 349063]GJC96301.1 protein kinase [Colletotrichum higginsianum]CCF38447.1 protein kinase [Colletotrichum higginsianum]